MKTLASTIAALFLSAVPTWAQGGPVILMGIDAEDGGPGGHGPISVYEDVVTSLLAGVDNGGSGVLVIGGGKAADDVTDFWDTLATNLGIPITYANGAASIGAASFAGYALIAVVSDNEDTPSGGLTLAEHAAINLRKDDVAAHVNGGGGLLGFSTHEDDPYGYVSGIGADCEGNSPFSFAFPDQYDEISATAEGTAVGITDALDICCWHDEYIAFPSFFSVLATNDETGKPAAIGGDSVFIPTGLDCPDDVTVECGSQVESTVVVTDSGCLGNDVTVTWEVDGVLVQTDVVPGTGDPLSELVTLSYLYPEGTHLVRVSSDNGEVILTCEISVTVEDTTAPVVACTQTTNPAGKNIPKAGNNPKSGQNPDGFYTLGAEDNCDSDVAIYIVDSVSAFVAGPFANGDKVKITQAPGKTPSQKPMAGVIVAHLHLKGDAGIYAVDAAGNVSEVGNCLVPPLPK